MLIEDKDQVKQPRRPVIEFVNDDEDADEPETAAAPEAEPEKPAESVALVPVKQPVTPREVNSWLSDVLTWGTPLCGLVCGVCGIVIAVLMLTIGFWKTLFVALMCAAGMFCGAVSNKLEWIKKTINRLFPQKDDE